MPDLPLAYFLTLSSYGSRLHGDERGTVDRHTNSTGTSHLRRDDLRAAFERRIMVSGGFTFDAATRAALQTSFAETCQRRGWGLLALNIRMSHLHAVVAASVTSPEAAMQALKANGTRALREQVLIGPAQKVWSRHGSTIYLWETEHVESAMDYTMNRQGADLPGSDKRLWWSGSPTEV